jgi:hypothetical protein
MTIYIFYRETKASAVIGREASQEVNADRTKCVYMCCEQNGGEINIVKIGNKSYENAVKFRYMEATITYQNYIREQNNNKVNSGNNLQESSSLCVYK